MRKANIVGWGGRTTQQFSQHLKTIEMLGARRNIFGLYQITANIENEDITCPNKVIVRANISANFMFGERLVEMLLRLTAA